MPPKRIGEYSEHVKLLSAVDKENNDFFLFSAFGALGAAFTLKPLGHAHP